MLKHLPCKLHLMLFIVPAKPCVQISTNEDFVSVDIKVEVFGDQSNEVNMYLSFISCCDANFPIRKKHCKVSNIPVSRAATFMKFGKCLQEFQ